VRSPDSRGFHVVIDGYDLIGDSRHRGIGRYVRNLVTNLAALPSVSLTVLGPASGDLPAGARGIPLPTRTPLRLLPSNTLRGTIGREEQRLRRARALRGLDASIFHSAGQEVPRALAVPFVQTIHDLTPLVFDHPLLRKDRRRWEHLAQRVLSAAAVVVPSRSTADQVLALIGVPAERIHVIPHAADIQPPVDRSPRSDPPYLLVVSAWGPHKGFREASEVIGRLARLGQPHRLRIAGRLDEWQLAHATADVLAGGGADRTDLVGFVEDLPSLYRGASVILCTSRAEGFGLPVLEAMAVGAPVVAFANSSLIEVVGDGGILVPDGDADEMASVVGTLLDDEAALENWRGRARTWAERYSWTKAANEHLAVYRAVSGC